MPVRPESIQAGKCYLVEGKHVWRVVRILPDRRIQYEARMGYQPHASIWKFGTIDGPIFATQVECEVPCDWMSETGKA